MIDTQTERQISWWNVTFSTDSQGKASCVEHPKQEWMTSIAHLNEQIIVSPRSTYKCVNKTDLKIANSYCRRTVST